MSNIKFSPQDCKLAAEALKILIKIYKKYGIDKTQPNFFKRQIKMYEILKEVK